MSVEGLAPEPTITNIEMTDIDSLSDEPIAYNTAVVTVEITETISDEFSATSWFNDGSYSSNLTTTYSPSGEDTSGLAGLSRLAIMANFNISQFLYTGIKTVVIYSGFSSFINVGIKSFLETM